MRAYFHKPNCNHCLDALTRGVGKPFMGVVAVHGLDHEQNQSFHALRFTGARVHCIACGWTVLPNTAPCVRRWYLIDTIVDAAGTSSIQRAVDLGRVWYLIHNLIKSRSL